MVQIPTNILDRRFERAGVFARVKEQGVEVFVRSVFLQGLLLMDPGDLPAHLEFARPLVERVEALARALGVSRLALTLQYVKTAFPEAHVIVGAETPEQVRKNIEAWNAQAPVGIVKKVREALNDVDDMAIDPRKWSILHLQYLVTTQQPEKSDAIIWLQGNRYDRGKKVLELYRGGLAPLVVVTGNNTRVVEDDNVRVDDIIKWLKNSGVGEEELILDNQSFNTYDQAVQVIGIAKEREWQAILLVGSTHHQLRAFLTFLHQARLQEWKGKMINQPAHIEWDAKPSGRSKTTRVAFQDEIKKLEKYRDSVAAVDQGLRYFRI